MAIQFHKPPDLFGIKLDAYLNKGWFRSGQYIYTLTSLTIDQNIYFPVRIRLHLEGYEFRKGHRKICKKNNRFQTIVKKAVITPEKEALYKKYLIRFDDFVAPTIKDSLQDGGEITIYDTYEIAVYEQKKLIAVSFFDVGEKSIASIMGVFDPDYSSYSLGFYTMLAEIHFGRKHGYTFYYPGYVVPGYPKFDYKLRIGKVEFYNQEQDIWFFP